MTGVLQEPLRKQACLALLPAAAFGIQGCASLPELPPRAPAAAMPASESTALGRLARAAQPDPELSGFRLLPSGDFALHARLELARRAEQSLDVQYYQIADGDPGEVEERCGIALRDAVAPGRERIEETHFRSGGKEAKEPCLHVEAA